MFEPDFSQLFTTYEDPESGVRSHILTRRVAPVQTAFYFVNSSFSADACYLWFYCAFPPSRERTLGVVDFKRQEVRRYPETGFSGASPLVDDRQPGVYWCSGSGVWRRNAEAEALVEEVGSVPDEVMRGRRVGHLATHLTLCADGRRLLLDAFIGDESVIGTISLSGEYELWAATAERYYNHGQFSPTDPELALLAWDHHTHPFTGETTAYEDRLWLLRRGEEPRPLFSTPTRVTHEWWDADGRHVWCVETPRPDLPRATYKVDVRTCEVEEGWPDWHWHAHDWNHGQYVVGDRRGRFYRGCPSSVHFCNNETGRQVTVISHNPEHLTVGRQYHIDPHPRFSPCGRFVTHSTTVLGQPDLAVTPVAPLTSATE
ncbi:MAG: hypothetical protein R6X33_13730 [Candidatus Brocadiia bacterium]